MVERSCLEFLGGVRIEFRYAGCAEESAIEQILKIMR